MPLPDVSELEENGYTVVRDFLSEEAVAALRAKCAGLPWQPGLNGLLPLDFVREADLVDIVTGDDALDCGERVAGPGFTILPNFTARRNSLVPWHIDPAFRGGLGGLGHRPSFVQCAVYLQDNAKETGGGLDVVPGSHYRECVDGRWLAPAECLDLMPRQRTVASRAGDLVLWDGRLLHASTSIRGTPALDKYAIHWTIAAASADFRGFLRHLRHRATPNSGAGSQSRYRQMDQLRYPDGFRPAVCERLDRRGVRLATMADLDDPSDRV